MVFPLGLEDTKLDQPNEMEVQKTAELRRDFIKCHSK